MSDNIEKLKLEMWFCEQILRVCDDNYLKYVEIHSYMLNRPICLNDREIQDEVIALIKTRFEEKLNHLRSLYEHQ